MIKKGFKGMVKFVFNHLSIDLDLRSDSPVSQLPR